MTKRLGNFGLKSFIHFNQSSDSGSDNDDGKKTWTQLRSLGTYAAGNPFLTKIVQEHDQKMSERLNQGIAKWVEGVQSETPLKVVYHRNTSFFEIPIFNGAIHVPEENREEYG